MMQIQEISPSNFNWYVNEESFDKYTVRYNEPSKQKKTEPESNLEPGCLRPGLYGSYAEC